MEKRRSGLKRERRERTSDRKASIKEKRARDQEARARVPRPSDASFCFLLRDCGRTLEGLHIGVRIELKKARKKRRGGESEEGAMSVVRRLLPIRRVFIICFFNSSPCCAF